MCAFVFSTWEDRVGECVCVCVCVCVCACMCVSGFMRCTGFSDTPDSGVSSPTSIGSPAKSMSVGMMSTCCANAEVRLPAALAPSGPGA